MAEESIGEGLPSSSVEQSEQSTEALLREFEERLTISSDEEEFHDAQDEPQAVADCSGLPEIETVTTTDMPNTLQYTQSDSTANTQIKTQSDTASTEGVTELTPGTTDRLPEFQDTSTTFSTSTLPGASETPDINVMPDLSDTVGDTAAESESSSSPINVDEIVQEAVEGGAALDDDPDEEIEVDEEQLLKDLEATWSEEEKEDKKSEAQELKTSGNELFKQGCIEEAKDQYTAALALCPTCFPKERSIMYSNRAACKMRGEDYEGAIKDCTKALDLNPGYTKCVLRRAELQEKTEKLDEALVDYKRVLEIDPSVYSARQACLRLPDQIKERNEKMKEEMMGKLKDLGNMILKPFGLSTDSFQMQQDPNSGGYSVNFKR